MKSHQASRMAKKATVMELQKIKDKVKSNKAKAKIEKIATKLNR